MRVPHCSVNEILRLASKAALNPKSAILTVFKSLSSPIKMLSKRLKER